MLDEFNTEAAKLIKGIVICKESGEYLLDLILDSVINPVLLSSFVGALCLFGKENLGKIEEINIKGLDVDMIIVYKYNLILIAMVSKEFSNPEIRKQAEIALDMFYTTYLDVNDNKIIINTSVFAGFKKVLIMQLNKYVEEYKTTGEFGFFTDVIKRMRNGNAEKQP